MPGETVATAPLEEKAKSIIDLVKDALNILRDLFLLVLFCALIFSKSFDKYISNHGIQTMNLGIATWKNDASAAAQENTAATASLQQVASSLNSIAATSKDPAARQTAADAAKLLNGSLTSLDKANSKLAGAVAVAADAESKSADSATTSTVEGWAYLGEADRAHTKWMNPPQPKVNTPVPLIQVNDTLNLTDSVFLHADKGPGQTFNQAATLTAIQAGASVTVVQEQFSAALNGGDFVWAKIQLRR